MTPEERLASRVDADGDPPLTTDELDDILEMFQRVDSEGRAPGDDEWVPTYDLAAAAAEGWMRKAAMAAGRFDFQADGAQLSRSQVVEHCERMAERWRHRQPARGVR